MEWNRCFGCMRELHDGVTKCPHCGYDLNSGVESVHHLAPGTILNGKYIVGKVLGEGGFGISYLGWDLVLELKVAIKEFFPSSFVTRQSQYSETVTMLSRNQEEFYQRGLQKFLEEARTLAKLNDLPGIVQVKEFFRGNGTAYIVMGYAEGRSLKQLLKENDGRLSPELVVSMFLPIIDSLAMVHEQGLIHRDIAPDNLMVDAKGKIKLLDFGAARFFLSSENENSLSVILKRGYAPVEQYHTRGNQGPWTDVYALCATMYRAITGVTPPESLNRKIAADTLRRPSELGIHMDIGLENALMKGLELEGKNRFQNMTALKRALQYQGNRTSTEKYTNTRQPQNHTRSYAQGQSQPRQKKSFWRIPIGILAVIGGLFLLLMIIGLMVGEDETAQAPTGNDTNDAAVIASSEDGEADKKPKNTIEGNAYTVDAGGITADMVIPEEYVVFTREQMDLEWLEYYGLTEDEALSILEADNCYLVALSLDGMTEIMLMTEYNVVESFEGVSDAFIDKLMYSDELTQELEKNGATDIKVEKYENDDLTYLKIYRYLQSENAYGIQYYVILDHKSINIVLNRYNGEVTEEDEEVLKGVVDSTFFQ